MIDPKKYELAIKVFELLYVVFGGKKKTHTEVMARAEMLFPIVVTDDIMGKFTDFAPKFVKKYANLHNTMLDGMRNYVREVKDCEFPSQKESFELSEEEKGKLDDIK